MKPFASVLAEAKEHTYVTKGADHFNDGNKVTGRKAGKTKEGHHIIAASVTHNKFTQNKRAHQTYVVHKDTHHVIASHDGGTAEGQKAAVAHAKKADHFWSGDRDPAKNWHLHHNAHDRHTMIKEEVQLDESVVTVSNKDGHQIHTDGKKVWTKGSAGAAASPSLANFHSGSGGTAAKRKELTDSVLAAHSGGKDAVAAAVKKHGYSHHDWK